MSVHSVKLKQTWMNREYEINDYYLQNVCSE